MTYDIRDFGAVGDGVTDDTNALVAALDALANGDTLVFPNGQYMILSWAPYSLDREVTLHGIGTSAALWGDDVDPMNPNDLEHFIIPTKSIRIINLRMKFWDTILLCSGLTTTIDEVRSDCNFSACEHVLYGIVGASGTGRISRLTINGNYAWVRGSFITCDHILNSVFITKNEMDGGWGVPGAPRGGVRGIQLGNNTEEKARNIYIAGNYIHDMKSTIPEGEVKGILAYGERIVIEGNIIENITKAVAGINCEGIYIKAIYSNIRGNTIKNVYGGQGAITIKGGFRAEQSNDGYAVIVSGNTIMGSTEDPPTKASWGIGVYTEEVLVCDNVISGAVGYGILMSGNDSLSHTGAGGNCIQNNTIRNVVAQDSGNPGFGIYVLSVYNFTCSFNRIEGTASHAIVVDNHDTTASDLSNITLIGNTIKSWDGYAIRISGNFVQKFYHCVVVQGNTVDGGDAFLYGRGQNHSIIGNTARNLTHSFFGGYPSGDRDTLIVRSNNGYVTENGGLATGLTSGATIAHGVSPNPFSVTAGPDIILVTPASPGVSDLHVSLVTSTTFALTWTGGGTESFYWQARRIWAR